MKILFQCVVLFVIVVSAFSEPPTPGGESSIPGRYQVVIGKVDYYTIAGPEARIADLKEISINTAIMVDTVTGKAWFLQRTGQETTDDKKQKVYLPAVRWEQILDRR